MNEGRNESENNRGKPNFRSVYCRVSKSILRANIVCFLKAKEIDE